MLKMSGRISLYVIIMLLFNIVCGFGMNIKADESQEKVFYVSTQGKDTNDGSINAPFATLEKARDAIRQLKNEGAMPAGGIKVCIRGGVYERTDSFMLNEQDSGTKDAPIIYQAYENEKVDILGGITLKSSDFQPVTDSQVLNRLPADIRDKVVQINLKAVGINDYGEYQWVGMGQPASIPVSELYFNGEPMTVSRYPNNGYVKVKSVIDQGSLPRNNEKPDRGGIFVYDDDRPSGWKQLDDAWMFGYWALDWADSTTKIESIDPVKKTIKTVYPHRYGYKMGTRYYYFNILEEIDMPGEYYIDRKNGMLYFYPPAEMKDGEIQFSTMVNDMVNLNKTSNVVFKGINFEVTRGNGFSIKDGDNNLIDGCVIKNIGQDGITVQGGKNCGVINSTINNIGSTGVILDGGDLNTLTPAGHYGENNNIFNFGRIIKTYEPAFQIFGVGNRISHNLIHDARHMGVNFKGVEHIIEYNEIYNVVNEADDSGAIYSWNNLYSRGNIIRYNYIHDLPKGTGGNGTAAIYADDKFSGLTVYGNLFANVQTAFFSNGGSYNKFINNIVINATKPLWVTTQTGVSADIIATLNTVPYKSAPWSTKYPELADIKQGDKEFSKNCEATKNLFYKCGSNSVSGVSSKYGKFSDNITTTDDPGFLNEENMNFGLKDDAIIYSKIPNFERIPFEQAGLK